MHLNVPIPRGRGREKKEFMLGFDLAFYFLSKKKQSFFFLHKSLAKTFWINVENTAFCPINPSEQCGLTCFGPTSASRVLGTQVDLTCSNGYENSTDGMKIISECKEDKDGNGVWLFSDTCKSIIFSTILHRNLFLCIITLTNLPFWAWLS